VNAAMAAMEADGIRCRGYKAAGTSVLHSSFPHHLLRRSRASLMAADDCCRCVSTGRVDVVEGKPAALAEVVWQLMLHYHCRWRPSAEELAALASPRCPPPPLTPFLVSRLSLSLTHTTHPPTHPRGWRTISFVSRREGRARSTSLGEGTAPMSPQQRYQALGPLWRSAAFFEYHLTNGTGVVTAGGLCQDQAVV
jgi:hypothetical protein